MMSIIFISIIINVLIFFYNERIASLLKLYDKPDNIRKVHKSNVPLTGGIFVLSNIFIVIIFLFTDSFYLERIEIFNYKQDLILFSLSIMLFFLIYS